MGIRPAVPPTAASENPTKLTHGLRADVRPRGGGWVVNGNTNRPGDPACLSISPRVKLTGSKGQSCQLGAFQAGVCAWRCITLYLKADKWAGQNPAVLGL